MDHEDHPNNFFTYHNDKHRIDYPERQRPLQPTTYSEADLNAHPNLFHHVEGYYETRGGHEGIFIHPHIRHFPLRGLLPAHHIGNDNPHAAAMAEEDHNANHLVNNNPIHNHPAEDDNGFDHLGADDNPHPHHDANNNNDDDDAMSFGSIDFGDSVAGSIHSAQNPNVAHSHHSTVGSIQSDFHPSIPSVASSRHSNSTLSHFLRNHPAPQAVAHAVELAADNAIHNAMHAFLFHDDDNEDNISQLSYK